MDKIRREAAGRLVARLIDAYNRHDATACAACYAEGGVLFDQAWNERHDGVAAIRKHYAEEFDASPDIELIHTATYESTDWIAIEAVVRGTHDGTWRGLPATGNRFEMSVFISSRVSADGNLATESRFNYDRATVFQQIGVLHDPSSALGKTLTVLSHPVTMAQAARKRISVRPGAPH